MKDTGAETNTADQHGGGGDGDVTGTRSELPYRQTQTHSQHVARRSLASGAADIPDCGCVGALFGLAEREQHPFSPRGCAAHVSPAARLHPHTQTHTHTPATSATSALSKSCLRWDFPTS